MTNTDLLLIYKKFEEIDRQLKEMRKEIGSVGIGLPKSCSQMIADDKPAQWPNEPYTDYLKRIGEYNEAMIYEDDSK
jgi:hypothetical protein